MTLLQDYLNRPVTEIGGLDVSDWLTELCITLNEKTVYEVELLKFRLHHNRGLASYFELFGSAVITTLRSTIDPNRLSPQ